LNGKSNIIIAVYQLPGSNAVQTAAGIRKLVAEMKQRFPQDMDYAISLDQTAAVTEGIKEIVENPFDRHRPGHPCRLPLPAGLARYADPDACRARLAGWHICPLPGLRPSPSIRFSMFGLVLAVGLVVDDAIVVVEGVQRHIEEGLAPKDAARKAMEELSGPVIAIALVLSFGVCTDGLHPGHHWKALPSNLLSPIAIFGGPLRPLTLSRLSPALAGLLASAKGRNPRAAQQVL